MPHAVCRTFESDTSLESPKSATRISLSSAGVANSRFSVGSHTTTFTHGYYGFGREVVRERNKEIKRENLKKKKEKKKDTWLEVTVDNVLLMEVRDGSGHLAHNSVPRHNDSYMAESTISIEYQTHKI